MAHYAITVGVENRRGEDTAHGDAEAEVRDRLQSAGIEQTGYAVMWSDTVSRPTMTNGNTVWGVQVTVDVNDRYDTNIDEVDAESIAQVSVQRK